MSRPEQDQRLDYLELPVPTPEALGQTRDFMTRVFGWTYQAWGDAYADTASSGLGSGLNAEPFDGPPRPLPVIYTVDLEATLARVQEAGATIVKPIFSFPGGRRFHFVEPSGNELAVWSDQPAPGEAAADD